MTGRAGSDAGRGPHPATRHPLTGHPRVGFLRPLAIRWWDWEPARITRNLAAIRGADIDALERTT